MVCDQVSRPLTSPLVGPPCPPTATEAKWSSFGRFSYRTQQSESKVKGGGAPLTDQTLHYGGTLNFYRRFSV